MERAFTYCCLLVGVSESLIIPSVRSKDALPSLNSWLSKELLAFDKVSVAQISEDAKDWALVTERSVSRGEVALEIPMSKCLSAKSARLGRCGEALTGAEAASGDEFEPLCGEVTLIAMQLSLLASEWTECLVYPKSLPLLSELDDEALEYYSSRALGVIRANADDDYEWLSQHGFFSSLLPEAEQPDLAEWRQWIAIALSRSFPIDDELVLAPGLDFINHDDLLEVDTLQSCIQKRRTLRGEPKIVISSPEALQAGSLLTLSYGAMPAASYLESYGFLPTKSSARRASAAVELRFELDPQDRFLDDKRDIYEMNADDDLFDDGIDFCLEGSEPDPDYMRFARLKFLGGTDAFLLEPIFSKEIWDFLDLPVSKDNELDALSALADECRAIKAALSSSPPPEHQQHVDENLFSLLNQLRTIELAALDLTLNWIEVDINSLDTKEYYQERRLKDLGLDTEWCAEDQGAQWSGTRTPGGVDW